MGKYIFSGYDQSKYSDEQNAKFEQEFLDITEELATLFEANAQPDSAQVRSAIDRHYNYTCNFWTPNHDSYRSLAMSYVIPSPARTVYENRKAGLAKYVHDCVVAYANSMQRADESEDISTTE